MDSYFYRGHSSKPHIGRGKHFHLAWTADLQQTPVANPKSVIRVFSQALGEPEQVIHTFQFSSATKARTEADAMKNALQQALQKAKGGSLAPGRTSSSAAMAIASAVSSKNASSTESDMWYSDSRLGSDVELQKSLLKANPLLSKTFMESLRTKPESISSSQFTAQFWVTRVHLLRAYAVEKSQTRGAYNVLSTIKPRTEDNTIKLSISKEQIQLIFSQHSLVKRVYDESVPKLSEEAFWSRFFQSRLFKKLKGEKILENDPTDPALDKYLTYDDDLERMQRLLASHVPHIIDIEGNEENHSQRKGNQPDITMRPTSVDRVPIIRTLNSLSEKLLSHVAPNDVDPSEPIGMDEETFNSLALRDLQGDAEENHIMLNIRDQGGFFSSNKEIDDSVDARTYTNQDPAAVMQTIHSDLASTEAEVDLGAAIGYNNDSSDSEPEELNSDSHVGSKSSFRGATSQVFAAIAQQRAQNDDLSTSSVASVSNTTTSDLSKPIFDRLLLTHATTTEFLHHFWLAFLSGDPTRAEEVSKLIETLDRAMDRIKSVASDAEKERMSEVETLRKQVKDHYERTHKKLLFNADAIKGGAKAVNQLMAPTVEAIRVATTKYRIALAEENGT